MLQIFDAREDTLKSTEPPSITGFSTSPDSKNIGDFVQDAVRRFNIWDKESTRNFLNEQGFLIEKKSLDSHRNKYYYHSLTGFFPANAFNFLRLLGAMEGIFSTISRNSKNRGLKTAIDVLPVEIDASKIEKHSLTHIFNVATYKILNFDKPLAEEELNLLPEKLLVGLAKLAIEKISKNPILQKYYKEIDEKLISLLAQPGSLSNAIQEATDKYQGLDRYLTLIKSSNPDIAPMYDPSIPLSQRILQFLSFFTKKISACPDYVDIPQEIRDEKNALFKSIEVENGKWKSIKKSIWEYILKRVVGKGPAEDGQYYTEKHSEICLLRSAELKLHTNGLIELLFKDTKEYKEYYGINRSDHADFIKEIIKVCDFLKLPLHENRDLVSHEKIFFSQEASRNIVNYGLHINRRYIDSCLVTSHRARLFRCVKPDNLTKPSPGIIKEKNLLSYILRLAAPTTLLDQDFDWAMTRDFSKSPSKK